MQEQSPRCAKNMSQFLANLYGRASRRWAVAEALALGYGGITTVGLATGMSDRTLRTGIRELESTSFGIAFMVNGTMKPTPTPQMGFGNLLFCKALV
jgi:hypothetical protein